MSKTLKHLDIIIGLFLPVFGVIAICLCIFRFGITSFDREVVSLSSGRKVQSLYEYEVEIVRVIDGDTVEADVDLGFRVHTQQILRLYQIDAPEMRGLSKAAGIESKSHLEQLLAAHEEITIRTLQDRTGKYGRYLAILLGRGGQNLNEQMVIDGYAKRLELK